MNVGPQHLQMKPGPQCLQMNSRPQRPQMNVRPQCPQINVGPQSLQMNQMDLLLWERCELSNQGHILQSLCLLEFHHLDNMILGSYLRE